MADQKANRRGQIVFVAAILLLGGGGLMFMAASSNAPSITVNSRPVKAEQLALGKTTYEAQCAACHGIRGEGQPNWKTPDSNNNWPAPPHDASGHTWHHPDSLLLDIIANGGSQPGTNMPAFKDTLSPQEQIAVLAYIKSFWGEQELAFQQQVTQQAGN